MNAASRRQIHAFLALLACLGITFAGSPATAQNIAGSYAHVRDSDGTKPNKDASVTLTFAGGASGSVALLAVQPGQTVTDSGTYSVQGDRITIRFQEVEWAANNQPFQFDGCSLTLPFKALSSTPGSGTSTWVKQDSKCQPGGLSGFANSSGAGKSTKGKPQPTLDSLVGNWTGHGASEEVRSRHPGLLTLTVKHDTEFFFHVNEKGEVDGEGTVEYDLERNTQGLDSLAAYVRGLMSLAPVPAPPGGAVGKLAEGAIGKAGEIPGGRRSPTGLQYDAPHLKNGKEIRHIKFRGHVERVGDEWWMYLEQYGDFVRPDGVADGQLIAAWEVNGVQEQKPFPCWSPFLQKPGILRLGPGDAWVVEFQEKGEHRNGVTPWQDYSYVWMARQVK